MTPLLRASPSPGPCPPSPDRGSAPPRPSRRPALPVTLCATCPADSICAHAASACAAQPQATRAASHAQRVGGRTLARTASGCRLSRAATPGLTAHTLTGLAAEHRPQQSSPAALSSGSTLALQHTCFAGTHALQHTLGRCNAAVDLYPYLQERGWDGYRPLNGCSQGLVVRGISPPEPCLYTCHTKVFSKVSNSPPIHQYFPAASPYGAQPGGWIGKADCYL